ncbi:DUF1176 domain-containing protein [Pantanalinema sp. GBBB05]|uniref:DUF1176 domain-containing protein n=1 Tax=Pantanalinema sp. GBBB05 TaxID=2604139 RepID=UPI001D67BBC1|nr:DUF1176 domain-containing protein [Pantanalinema sp. GBBB05]
MKNRITEAVLIAVLLQLLAIACSAANHQVTQSPPATDPASPSISPSATPTPTSTAQFTDDPEQAKYLDAIESLRVIPSEKPEYREVVERLLKHEDAVKQMLKGCDPLDAEAPQLGSQFYKTSDSSYIVMLQCFLGAYQGGFAFYLYTETPNGATVQPLTLDRYDDDAGKVKKTSSHTAAGYPEYNPDRKTLVLSTKYRGVGDCGTTGTYQFANNKFVLKQFEADFACDGKLQYKTVYP